MQLHQSSCSLEGLAGMTLRSLNTLVINTSVSTCLFCLCVYYLVMAPTQHITDYLEHHEGDDWEIWALPDDERLTAHLFIY